MRSFYGRGKTIPFMKAYNMSKQHSHVDTTKIARPATAEAAAAAAAAAAAVVAAVADAAEGPRLQ